MRRPGCAGVLLAHPPIYRFFQFLVGPRTRHRFLREHVEAAPDLSYLEAGSGEGLIAEALFARGCHRYLGVDLEPRYVEAARKRYGDYFRLADVSQADPDQFARYDRVLAYGLLHHLNDAQAKAFLEFVTRVLTPDGLFVSLDGCFIDGVTALETRILKMDRGEYIRTAEEYRHLVAPHFETVKVVSRRGMLWIPYPVCIMQCS